MHEPPVPSATAEVENPASGTTRIESNDSLELTDPAIGWVLESGEVMVFAVDDLDGRAEGRRRPVAVLVCGEMVVGVPPAVGGQTLVAVALTASRLRSVSSASLPDRGVRWAELLAEADRARDEELANRANRLQAAGQRDESTLDTAVRALASALPGPADRKRRSRGSQLPPDHSDDVQLALHLLLGPSGAEQPDENRLRTARELPLPNRVRAAAEAYGYRARRVSPPRRWWTGESGSLLGVRSSDRRPVALLSEGSSYLLIDPVTLERQRVTETVADGLEPEMFAFVRALPKGRVTVARLLRLGLSGSRRDIVSVIVLANVIGLIGLVLPVGSQIIFSQVVPGNERGVLAAVVAGLILLAMVVALGTVARSIAFLRFRTRLDSTAQPAIWERLLTLPARFFTRYSVGSLLTRVQSLDYTRQLLGDAVVAATLSGFFALYNLLLLFVFQTALGVIGAILAAAQIATTVALAWAQLRPARRELAEQAATQGMTLELIKGAAKLQVAGARVRAFGVWSRHFHEQWRHAYHYSRWTSWQTVLAAVWPTLSILVLVVGLGTLAAAQVDPGEFISFSVALGQVTAGVAALGVGLSTIVQCVPYLELLDPVLAEQPEVSDAQADPGMLQGRVELSHIRFRYSDNDPLVLDDLSLSAQPGQFVAVVGPSGAGKSSMLRLLLGFETPESGTVSYDGRDLSGIDAAAVRRQLGTVLQSAQVIPGTLFANIAGATAMTRSDAWQAAEAAGLADDIRAMPMGMETLVSEGASTLSGGQRQRLLIARALSRNPRVLLFDEATSALDNLTQAVVAKSIAELGVTRIVIAHRLSTIRNADIIYVLDRGRVVEQGDFDTLSAADGPFSRLAARQLG